MDLPRPDFGLEKSKAGGISVVLSVPASAKHFTWINALLLQSLCPSSGQHSLVIESMVL